MFHLAITLLMLVMAVLSYFLLVSVSAVQDMAKEERAVFLNDKETEVMKWYRSNIATLSAQDRQVQPPITGGERWGVVALSSNRLSCAADVMAHRFAIVIPSTEGMQTTMDINTGIVTKGRHDMVKTIDGCKIAIEVFEQARQRADRIVSLLENYFKAHAIQEGGLMSRNYFIGNACRGWGDMPCTEGSDAIILAHVLGGDVSDFTAYDRQMIFDNLSPNVNARIRPFSARVGFTTPWGQTIWRTAIEQR